jgi:DNA transformation protein
MAGYDPHLEDLFAPVGGVAFRRMFGGVGIFKETLMFALIADDVLYFKANDATKAAFEAEDCGPWSYESRKGTMAMPYWRVPERLFDEPDEFAEWARRAFAVAVANRAAKEKPKRAGKKAAKKPVGKK